MPGSALRLRMAVTVEMEKMTPMKTNICRSPVMAATSSGATCRHAFLDAGFAMPLPRPVTAAPMLSHR
jgi:hypothetical protein